MSRFKDLLDGLSRPIRDKFCSTFGIVNASIGASIAGDSWDGVPGNRNQFADNALAGNATFTGCTCAFVAPVTAIRAYVWMKNFKSGVASGGFIFQLQAATNAAGFNATSATTGTAVIALYQTARATSSFYINGVLPGDQNYTAARLCVFPVPNGTANTDTASFDCNIDAT